MKKLLLIVIIVFAPLISSAEIKSEDIKPDNTFEYNFYQLEKAENNAEKQKIISQIKKDMISYADYKEFIRNNFDRIKEFSFWKKAVIISDKEFLQSLVSDSSLDMDIRNFAALQITDNISKLDEIYHYFDRNNSKQNKEYAKQQALYTLFNQSDNFEKFKKNLEKFKYIDALESFDKFFPNHIYYLKLKQEINKKKEAEKKRLRLAEEKEKQKKILIYSGAGFFAFLLLLLIIKFFVNIKKSSKTDNNYDSDKQSFSEILANAPVSEIYRENKDKIIDMTENIPALKDALSPFAEEYGVDFTDMVLISEYINNKSAVTDSGIEKLKEICADYQKGIVFSVSRDEFLILCKKDVY